MTRSTTTLTTRRLSLCFLADSEKARVWGTSGRAARLAARAAVRIRKGVSLLAMAAAMSVNGAASIGFGVAIAGPISASSSFGASLIGVGHGPAALTIDAQ
jgi:hypothetical protein